MLNLIILILGVLLSVAFFTLLERKVLGFIHLRLGPNKVFFFGILQPLSDAIKLFFKETIYKLKVLNLFMIISPMLFVVLSLLYWMSFYSLGVVIFLPNFILLIFSIFSLNVYPILMMGFISFSKFSILGSYRLISQSVSYEISLIIYAFSFLLVDMKLNMISKSFIYENYSFYMFFFPLMILWLVMCLVESNRTPFDLSEGESELVSGFNTEYEGGLFSLIFISEYSSLLFLSSLTVLIFFNMGTFSFFMMLICFWMIWVRGTFPRFRYDKLMMVAWKIFLPLSLLLISFFL